MFISYSFLHAGLGHLIGNMLALAFLGQRAVERVGRGGFALLYVASMLGGGLAFGLLAHTAAPMIGASGAVFGLAGGWVVWHWQDLRAAPDRDRVRCGRHCGSSQVWSG